MIPLSLADLEIDAECGPQKCELSLRLRPQAMQRCGDPSELPPSELQWSGKLRGPFCLRSQTLAANYPLRAHGGAEARAILPDCCYWTAELPFTYELDLELRRGGQPWAQLRETIAIPWLRLHQGKLYRSAKRWAPRIARLELPPLQTEQERAALPSWLESVRQHDLALVLSLAQAEDPLLEACRRMGVSVAVDCDQAAPPQLPAWENGGTVFLLLQHSPAPLATRLLLGRPSEADRASGWESWEVLQQMGAGGGGAAGRLVRRRGSFHSAAEARRACDALQADSASEADWLGYLIH